MTVPQITNQMALSTGSLRGTRASDGMWPDGSDLAGEGSTTMSEPDRVDLTTAWMQIVTLLTVVADRPSTRGGVDPDLHSVALGAQIVAARALALLPAEVDGDLEDVVIDVGPSATVGDLVRAASDAARRHPTEAFPAGAAAVIADLDDLVAEVEAVS